MILVSLLATVGCRETIKEPSESMVYTDTTFWQEYHQAFPVGADPLVNEVRSIVVDTDGNAWIATAGGIFVKKTEQQHWIPALADVDQGPAFSVATDSQTVWASTWNGVYRTARGALKRIDGPQFPIAVLCPSDEGMYALGPNGVWVCGGTPCEKKNYAVARSVRDAQSDAQGGLWVATDVGLYHCQEEKTTLFRERDQLVSAYIRGVAVSGDELWAAGLGGVTILREGARVQSLLPKDGLPSVQVNCVKRAPDGTLWIGTDVGVVRFTPGGAYSLRFSRRWLLDDKVNDIAFEANGDAWIATDGGVSVIRKKKMTLSSKQSYFYDVLMRRHIREPWIAGQCRLPVAGDTTLWEPEDDDNDGEFTGNYLAMESFRYAATKSNDAREKAKKAFHFLKLLADITESDGFFARTIVPVDWTDLHDVNRTYTPQQRAEELVKEPRFKPVSVRWRKSKDGKWMWKGDTSSDEISGHMFGYFIYYELAADDEEKAVVRSHVARVVDHLLAHDFTLTDVDGQPTRWGIWSPDKLNRDPEWAPDRSLNSMEMLSFVKLAYYLTGDEKYQSAYLRLINAEGYLDNMANIPNQNPAWFIYFDVILAAYQYPILMKCEKNPELVRFYADHLERWMQSRKDDRNPFINFLYSFASGKRSELEASVEFLKDTPLDLVDWRIDHSKREDVTFVRTPVLDELQVATLPPASIRATVRWDKNPWAIQEGDPHREREPVFWLLPYWMGRYLNMIQ